MTASSILFVVLALLLLLALSVIGWGVISTRRIARMANRLAPAMGQFLEVDSNRIHYYEIGEGRPILFIHGLGGHHHHMRRPLMEAFGPGFRLIAIDRAGSGHSSRARGMTGRLTEQARLIRDIIEKLGLERPLLVGHSLGGAVALATALDFPESVGGLALISPLTQPVQTLRPEFRSLYIPNPLLRRFIAHSFAVPLSMRHSEATLDFVFGPQKAPQDFAIEGGAILGMRPSHFYATSSDAVAIPLDLARQQARYRELSLPIGILFGTADRVLDYREHGLPMLDQVEELDLELLDGIGHMPQYSETERVVAFIRRVAQRAFIVDPPLTVS